MRPVVHPSVSGMKLDHLTYSTIVYLFGIASIVVDQYGFGFIFSITCRLSAASATWPIYPSDTRHGI